MRAGSVGILPMSSSLISRTEGAGRTPWLASSAFNSRPLHAECCVHTGVHKARYSVVPGRRARSSLSTLNDELFFRFKDAIYKQEMAIRGWSYLLFVNNLVDK